MTFTDIKCPCCGEYMAFVGQQVFPSGKISNQIHCTNIDCKWRERTHSEGETLKLWKTWGSPTMDDKDGAA